jgi:hypothetical protein
VGKAPRRTNPIVLRPGLSIGSVSAETDDEFLFDCFVTYPAAEQSANPQAPGMILAGRTGSGKTAIIRYLEHSVEHSVAIDPFDMALSYVSNSDILSFLHSIGADLDLLFQVLWKHVLCIEFIRLRFRISDEGKSRSVFGSLMDRFKMDQRKQKSIQYLREWQGCFWIPMDQNIKEITDKYSEKLRTELGSELPGLRVGGGYEGELSQEKKAEIITRTRRIISPEQLAELAGVIDILAERSGDDAMIKYFIIIDKLDERWVDDAIRFRLVRALIESLRAFRRIQNLKILVALRSDILERVVQETHDLGFQREKYEDYFIRLKWRKAELKELVQKRVNLLFKRKYSGSNVSFEDIFAEKIGGYDAFDYILERTLMRPRDVISFVNECLKRAEGQTEITSRFAREAEAQYSRIRREALENEWQSAFPTLSYLFRLLSARQESFTVDELMADQKVDELAFEIAADANVVRDPLFPFASDGTDNHKQGAKIRFVQHVVSVLYRVGAVGVKLRPDERFIYSHLDAPVISPEVLSGEVRVRIHPMLHLCLNIRR